MCSERRVKKKKRWSGDKGEKERKKERKKKKRKEKYEEDVETRH